MEQVLRIGTADSDSDLHYLRNVFNIEDQHSHAFARASSGSRPRTDAFSSSPRSLSSSHMEGQTSFQSCLFSPSNRPPPGEEAGSGSHETDILVVSTPPSARSSSAAASYCYFPESPDSTRSPVDVDPAPSSPLSPPHRTPAAAADTSSPLARARLALDSADRHSPSAKLLPQSGSSGADVCLTEAAATQPSTEFQKENPPVFPERPRPSTSSARVGVPVSNAHPADEGSFRVGAVGTAGAADGGLPSLHIPEIRGESADTARVLLQVMGARVVASLS